MRRFLPILLGLVAGAMAQYNDYPTGEYEFSHNRIVVSPLKMVGGMDPGKRDEGPKVNLAWTPNIDMLEMRYEYVFGVDGTLSAGPLGTYYPALDSVKGTAFAAGVYGRYYLDLGRGPYVQFSAQWYNQSGTQVRDGKAPDTSGNILPTHEVKVSGPQISPVLGYCKLVGDHLVLEAQMGFTLGYYDVAVTDGPVTTRGPHFLTYDGDGNPKETYGEPKVYQSGSSLGGFYFAQLSLGVAW